MTDAEECVPFYCERCQWEGWETLEEALDTPADFVWICRGCMTPDEQRTNDSKTKDMIAFGRMLGMLDRANPEGER